MDARQHRICSAPYKNVLLYVQEVVTHYIVIYYIKWVTTSLTYGTYYASLLGLVYAIHRASILLYLWSVPYIGKVGLTVGLLLSTVSPGHCPPHSDWQKLLSVLCITANIYCKSRNLSNTDLQNYSIDLQ